MSTELVYDFHGCFYASSEEERDRIQNLVAEAVCPSGGTAIFDVGKEDKED